MDYCYENLLNAVILQAVEDWRRSGKDNRSVIERQLRKNPLLSSYNLDYIFEKLKEEDDERRTKLQATRNNDSQRDTIGYQRDDAENKYSYNGN